MKCMVLAAGYATRLYPLTENFPKPLLRVGGRSILDRILDDIMPSGLFDEAVVISNAKYCPVFEEWAKDKDYKVTVVNDGTYTNETRLGAVKDVLFALRTLGIDDEVFVMAGDNVLDFSLTEFIKKAKEKNASCVMRYYEPDEKRLVKCGVVVTDENDRVLSMTEKSPTPASRWCCPPFYYFTREDAGRVAEGIAAGCGTDAPGSYVAWLSAQTEVYALEMPGKRYDVGNLESYERINAEFGGK